MRKIFGIEANRALNSEIYSNAHIILSLKRVSLLLNERQARRYFSQYKSWNKMNPVKQAEKLIDEMEYDAVGLGNHEFDWGEEWIKKNAELKYNNYSIPFLGANIVEVSLPKLKSILSVKARM